MERLYAVPSEKLRVWMVWLTGVSEIADEWQQWLREHIDLIARRAERRLQRVANNVPGGTKEIESVVSIDAISLNLDTRERRRLVESTLRFTQGISGV